MIIYLHGFNSSSSSSKAQLCKKYLNDKGISDKILIPDLPLSTDKVVNLIEILISENEIVGFIGSSMGGFYSCYFANKYNVKGVYINPVEENTTFKVRVYLEAKMAEVISLQSFHNNLIDIIPTVKKFGFQRDERTQWNKFLNEFLVFCTKEGLAESDNLPTRFQ